MTESYALSSERHEQDRNPNHRSHLVVVAEEYPGDEFPLTYDGPRNRCDMCGNWQAPEVGAICTPCAEDVSDDLIHNRRLEIY